MERIASGVEAQASSMESRAPASAEPSPSLLRRSARAVLKSIGWKTVLVPLPGPQGIVVVYPCLLYTSCVNVIVRGAARPPNADKPLPPVSPDLVAACRRDNPHFDHPKEVPVN